eukprot:gene3051-33445_t
MQSTLLTVLSGSVLALCVGGVPTKPPMFKPIHMCRSDAESAAAPGMDGVGSGVSIAISNYMPPTGGAGAAADKLSPLASPKTSPKVSRKGSKSPKAMKKGRKPKDAARASPSPLRKGATVKTTSN